MIKKILTAAIIVITLGAFVFTTFADAEELTTKPVDIKKEIRNDIKKERMEFHQSIKEERKDFKEKVRDMRQDFKASEAAKKKAFKAKAGHITGATITAISGSTLTVTKDGKTYTVTTSSKTKIQRHFWGKSDLSEFSVGNKVNAWGKWTDENKTTLDASVLRNLSIMKRYGVFFGEIASLGANSFVIKSINRGDQTVSYDAKTTFEDRRGTKISASDLKVGHKIRVKGLWDKTNKKVTQVKEIKDFSLPTRSTGSGPSSEDLRPTTTISPTPSATVTPTHTPTP